MVYQWCFVYDKTQDSALNLVAFFWAEKHFSSGFSDGWNRQFCSIQLRTDRNTDQSLIPGKLSLANSTNTSAMSLKVNT